MAHSCETFSLALEEEGWVEERWDGCFGCGALDASFHGKGCACCQPAETVLAEAFKQPSRRLNWDPGLTDGGVERQSYASAGVRSSFCFLWLSQKWLSEVERIALRDVQLPAWQH